MKSSSTFRTLNSDSVKSSREYVQARTDSALVMKDENISEIDIYEDYGEKIHETEESKPTEPYQVLTVFNKAIHHEDDSSDDISVIEIEPPKENGEQEIGKQDKLLTTKFQIEIENRKVEGLITYSTEQQIFKFKVNSENNQPLW